MPNKTDSLIIHEELSENIRLNKYISETGMCSRREADRLIEQGKVSVNGKIAEMGTKVTEKDTVKVNGKVVSKQCKTIYMVLNKPVGITCTTEKKVKGNIVDYVNHPQRIFPVGRLDKDSEGLIILTNDGDIVNKILRAGNNHDKEYIVTVNKPVTNEFIKGMASGVPILDTITKPCEVERINKNTFKIILTQGLNRQIRRMCEHFGYTVVKLKRTRIMNIHLDSLPTGQWRYLSPSELKTLNQLIVCSKKTEEASH